ncbi:MAG: enoyl-CoA hydratase/isomerase family protein [Hyphomicrobiaceae bacterium]|nr:enoyl-CoA hydratase/isomerase family protein [Hyphomicrobiaceae bacterium]
MTKYDSINTSGLHIRKEGRAGRITINKPSILNAINLDQVNIITRALWNWASDDEIQLVILDGTGGRALCAGGDIVSLYKSRGDGGDAAASFWCAEYRLSAMISHYPKPYVALMDGIVMGGGIGLSAHGSHRIVTECSKLAMPETLIGLIPDVGGLWLLANTPGHIGEYLGLLGEHMGAADALYTNFADTFVPQKKLSALAAAAADPDGDPIGISIAAFASAPPPTVHANYQEEIDCIFSAPTVELIQKKLDASSSSWAQDALAALSLRSPLALKLTLAGIRQIRRRRTLEDSLKLEYRIATRMYNGGEFIEGVRALLIDKDKSPKWTLPSLEAIDDKTVTNYLSSLVERPELDISDVITKLL